ncbi:MAG: hypothetical protein AAGA60_20410 [Cyanobacteria bacterium P01_E01_bin.42]
MLLRFIRKVKNRVFWLENKPEEGSDTDLNWIWQPFETSENLGFSVRVKKIVSTMIESSPDDIPKISLKLDPRLVIPLCAIQLRDEINLTRLRSFNEELESILLKTNFDVQAFVLVQDISPYYLTFSDQPPFPIQETFDIRERFSDRVVSQIEPTERWRYLFKSLPPELQFSLLSRLIKYPSPRPNDWRNLYEEIEYKLQNSWEYWVILIVVVLLSLGAVFEIVTLMISQTENWLNSLMAMAIVVILSFLIVLWQETRLERDKSEPTSTLLITLGLLGFHTFGKEWQQLLRKNRVGEGITALFRTVAVALVVVLAMAGALVGAVTVTRTLVVVLVVVVGTSPLVLAVAVVGAVVGAVAGVVVMDGAWSAEVMFWAVNVAVGLAMVVATAVVGIGIGAWTLAVVGTGAWTLALALVLGWGLGIWYRAKKGVDLRLIKFFSILAFPWFCWLPIVVGFMSFALYDRLSWGWQPICLFWLSILGFCTVLWVRGKTLEEKALNPLKGILGTAASKPIAPNQK